MSRLRGPDSQTHSPRFGSLFIRILGNLLGSSTVVPIAAPLAVHCLPFGHPDIWDKLHSISVPYSRVGGFQGLGQDTH